MQLRLNQAPVTPLAPRARRHPPPLRVHMRLRLLLLLACSLLCAARRPAISMAASMTDSSLNALELSTILLASMREKSRMSVMSASSVSPEQRIVLTRSHCC